MPYIERDEIAESWFESEWSRIQIRKSNEERLKVCKYVWGGQLISYENPLNWIQT